MLFHVVDLESLQGLFLTHFLSINFISTPLSPFPICLLFSELGMNHENRTTMMNMIFMYFSRNLISNCTANKHEFYYYLYRCSREDQLSYFPVFPAELLERDREQGPSLTNLHAP